MKIIKAWIRLGPALLMFLVQIPARVWGMKNNDERPRIGLVLGGGGARGAAHVGVLKVLDEERIPVDVVAGTSMGSIVGSLLAAGYSPEEMEQLFLSLDWMSMFVEAAPRDELSFRRKQDDRAYLIKAKLAIGKNGFAFPRGALQGQKFIFELRKILSRVEEIRDFDKLPIPFRAVAADIGTGEEVVLSSGSLPLAIRSSLSLPGILEPVELNGRTLVDGGIVNNLPVNVARTMGADRVIAIEIGTLMSPVSKLNSPLAILDQVATAGTRAGTDAQIRTLGPKDFFLQPDLGDVTTLGFDKIPVAIEHGYKAARAAVPALRQYALSPEAYEEWKRVHRRGASKPPVIHAVRIDNQSPLSDHLILSRIRQKTGQPLDLPQLHQDLTRLYGLDYFELVDHDLQDQPDKSSDLVILPRGKRWGTNTVQFGLNLEDDFSGGSSYNLGFRHTWSAINRLGAEWRNDFQIGERPLARTEFFQPLDYTGTFYARPNGLLYQQEDQRVSPQNLSEITKIIQQGIGLDFGGFLANAANVYTGVYRNWIRTAPQFGTPVAPEQKSNDGGYTVGSTLDTFDNPRFPHKGWYGNVNYNSAQSGMGASVDTQNIAGSLTGAATLGDTTVLLSGRMENTLTNTAPLYRQFTLGGFLNLSGTSQNQFIGQNAGLGRLMVYQQLTGKKAALIKLPLYLGVSAEAGNIWDQRSDFMTGHYRAAGSLFLGSDTPIGPLYVAHGWAENDQHAWYLFLGQTFH